MAVVAPASKCWGEKRGQDQIWGKSKKCMGSVQNLPLIAKTVKFGLILTHLKLFWGKLWGKKIFCEWQMPPMSPCGTATVQRFCVMKNPSSWSEKSACIKVV